VVRVFAEVFAKHTGLTKLTIAKALAQWNEGGGFQHLVEVAAISPDPSLSGIAFEVLIDVQK